MSAILFRGEPLRTETGGLTVAQRIYYERYLCTVPEAYYQTKESLSVYGMLHLEDKRANAAAMHRQRTVQIPIAGMCIYLEEGAPIQLVYPEESVTIYKTIVEHLNNWKSLMGGLVSVQPPMDDLRTLDTLAEMLYPLVKHYSPKTIHNSIFKDELRMVGVAQELEGLAGPISRQSTTPSIPDKPNLEEKDPGYISIADIVAKEAFKKPKW